MPVQPRDSAYRLYLRVLVKVILGAGVLWFVWVLLSATAPTLPPKPVPASETQPNR